jgi:transcription-repair coupling factor (superfamily II helicase)
MGYARVPTVPRWRSSACAAGILDVYGFGMAHRRGLEWWGDEVSSIRGLDLTSQRSQDELDAVTVLPITTAGRCRSDGAAGRRRRRTLLELLPRRAIAGAGWRGPIADEIGPRLARGRPTPGGGAPPGGGRAEP